jgi:flagellar FliL protein
MLGKGKKKDKDAHAAEADAAAPAAEGEGGEAVAEGGKKKLPMKLMIIAVVAVVFLAGGGATGYLLFLKPKHAPVKVAEVKPKAKKKEKGKDAKPEEGMGKTSDGPNGVTYYAFPTVLSDMQGADGRPGQVKLDMTFELANVDVADTINENMPRVKDMLQTFLRELRPEDISGSEGDFRLRQELMRRVNLIIAPAQINTINLTGIVIS